MAMALHRHKVTAMMLILRYTQVLPTLGMMGSTRTVMVRVTTIKMAMALTQINTVVSTVMT